MCELCGETTFVKSVGWMRRRGRDIYHLERIQPVEWHARRGISLASSRADARQVSDHLELDTIPQVAAHVD